ncbi:group II intron reverse transcriptase/maturase [Bacillus cereus]|nr:group II intron reverse transcriptase/maturase [Bacillus cereus]
MKQEGYKKLKDKKLRHAEYYGMAETFDELFKRSKSGENFKHLMKSIQSEYNILLAYRNIKRNSGSVTPGIDGVTIKEIENIEQQIFIQMVRKRFSNYKPRKVKRVDIPKPNGKTRPLGIPSMWDRIAQQCILQVLEPICEAKFNKHSYGFRPNRSSEHALADVLFRVNQTKLHYVVDIDIQGFFDEVCHTKLMRQIWTMGIRDKQLLVIIRKMLKAPIVMPKGEVIIPSKGTPQGGILSPLLANINLNDFDWWIANQWEERDLKEISYKYGSNGLRHRSCEYRKLRKSTNLKEMYIVRYADDFKILATNRQNAEKIFKASTMWLDERLKLPISKEKSKVTNLRKDKSEFLGFTIEVKPKNGTHVAYTHICPKAIQKIKTNLKEQIKVIQKQPNSNLTIEAIYKYNSMVLGIHNYYRYATHCNVDLQDIAYQIMVVMKNRLSRDGFTKKGKYNGHDQGILKYIKSDMMRYIGKNNPLVPIGYVQHKNPMNKKTSINKYTTEGRTLIHKQQGAVEQWKIQYLREHPVINNRATVEFNDNRIGKFIAQKGKCAVTGKELILSEMHCHHKKLWVETKDDSYNNLVIITDAVHKLIHATKNETIQTYLQYLELSAEMLKKLNNLRELVGNEKITENPIC